MHWTKLRPATVPLLLCLAAACEPAELDTTFSQARPVVLVTDSAIMTDLENRGISFSSAMGIEGPEAAGLMRADELYRESPLFQALADEIAGEIQGTKDRYDGLGTDAFGFTYKSRSGWGDSTRSAAQRMLAYRMPNPSWIQSPDVFFELTGVSNRFDRRGVPARQVTCGERRLIFRMAYDSRGGDIRSDRQEYSRLPLTLVVAFPQRGSDCRRVAEDWQGPGPDQSMGDWLAEELADLGSPMAIEVNVQIERWPQNVKPNAVGTFHGYSLFVFDVEGTRLTSALLENTPDVESFVPGPGDSDSVKQQKAARRVALMDWLIDNAEAVDQGTAILPNEFLATRVKSVTGMAMERSANRLFSQILVIDESDDGGSEFARRLDELDLGRFDYARSPRAFLRRLDGMTCVGCHQSRSIVGLHLAGEERHTGERSFNMLAVGSSTHLLDEVQRREDDLTAYLESGAHTPTGGQGVPMPPPEVGYTGTYQGVHGAPCSLGVDPGLSHLSCNAGLMCQDLDGRNDGDDAMGVCVTNVIVNGRRVPQSGDVCELYDYRADADPYEDTARLLGVDSGCLCGRKSSDFPMGGMCMDACIPGSPAPEGTTCGVVSAENFFNECFGKMPFEDCMNHALQNDRLLRNCDVDTPCRDEFACMRYPGRDASRGQGVCAPPYLFSQFLFGPHMMQ